MNLMIRDVVLLTGICFSVYFFAEDRYAKAGDTATKSQIQRIEKSIEEIRRQQLEDKIFELEVIPENQRTDAQKAMLKRYWGQLENLNDGRNR